MFKIKWDEGNNSVVLSNKFSDKEAIQSPRPIFFEELDLLGFGDHWDYPKCEEPLLWAIGRRYYYKGIFVAEAKGGNIYEKPILKIEQKLTLEPINIEKLVTNNLKVLKVLEGEAIDFIEDTKKKYNNKVDLFSVAFSGGKDSQVVLDLVSRVLAPDEYITVFTDTTMEIPFTHETVEKTKKRYKELYPNFQLFTIKPKESALDYWKKFGAPSRIHRWCCSVYKTVPFGSYLKDLTNGKKLNPINKILVFEGVRAEESTKRSKYNRITKNVKGTTQINAEAILDWNVFEVFLYLLFRKIELNKGYRCGLTRVGCSVCPFASDWSESILNVIAPNLISPYLNILTKSASLETNDQKKTADFIKKGQWKTRAGGRNIDTNGVKINITQNGNTLKAVLENERENFTEWLKVLGNTIVKKEKNKIIGEVETRKITNFEIIKIESNKSKIILRTSEKDEVLLGRLKRILYKTTYCIHCGTCEIECPTGALTVSPYLKIKSELCINCNKCLTFTEKGCLLAKSISVTEGKGRMKEGKIATSKYQTFGLRNEWLVNFINYPDNWFENNRLGLGNRQIESMIAWLKDCDLLDDKKRLTLLTDIAKKLLQKDEKVLWSIIWVNLFYNVKLIEWYSNEIDWGSSFSTKELVEMIVDYNPINKAKTTSNAINSLINMFACSALGDKLQIGIIEKKSNIRYIKKFGTDEIHPISIAYSLYKYAEYKKSYNLKVSEFYSPECNGGPYKLFGISKESFENILRGLQENKYQIVRVDLTANLDNIFLQENISSIEVLKILTH